MRMRDNFKKARKILGRKITGKQIVFVNGCCYGQDSQPNKGEYYKLCGQEFWELISRNENLYTDIIEPLGYDAKQKNENFLKEYSKVINLFTEEFSRDFCSNGEIDWLKLVEFSSKKK